MRICSSLTHAKNRGYRVHNHTITHTHTHTHTHTSVQTTYPKHVKQVQVRLIHKRRGCITGWQVRPADFGAGLVRAVAAGRIVHITPTNMVNVRFHKDEITSMFPNSFSVINDYGKRMIADIVQPA